MKIFILSLLTTCIVNQAFSQRWEGKNFPLVPIHTEPDLGSGIGNAVQALEVCIERLALVRAEIKKTCEFTDRDIFANWNVEDGILTIDACKIACQEKQEGP